MTVPDILCIGSVLWDILGFARQPLRLGDDVPGHIRRVPGGVALNIATTLARHGLRPALLSVVGRDAAGDDLVAACAALGLDCTHLYRTSHLPTDTYLAIECPNGLVAAIADAHSLEAAEGQILRPMIEGPLGTPSAPWTGPVAIDGNLTADLLAEIAGSPAFAAADLRVAPASPGKADRLVALLAHPRVTLYVNRVEAELIARRPFATASDAAAGLAALGARRVIVTDAARPCAEAGPGGVTTAQPPDVRVARVTGAGDAFMAAHVVADLRGLDPVAALHAALDAAAAHISGEPC
jgi:sugar/nucleoside kinase (ribokinase family)